MATVGLELTTKTAIPKLSVLIVQIICKRPLTPLLMIFLSNGVVVKTDKVQIPFSSLGLTNYIGG